MADKKYFRKSFRYDGKKYDVYGKTEKEAMEKLIDLKSSLKRGENTINGNMTVDAWFQQWFETYKVPSGITPFSLRSYSDTYKNHIGPAIGKMKLKNVNEIHLQKIMNSKAGMSYSFVSQLRITIKAMFSKARSTRLITFDPSENLVLPAYAKGTRRSITKEEREHILAVAETHRGGLWVLTMLYAGLRPGETIALLWEDVDFEKNEIHVNKAKEGGSNRIKTTKTPAGIRDIPMHSELRKRMWAARGMPKANVFQTLAGNPLNMNSVKRLWTNFKREVDIHMGAKVVRNKVVESVIAEDLTPYCFRHTFCTDLERAGVPINIAKELMGHSSIAITANIYTHKDAETLHQNMEKLEALTVKTPG